MNLRSYIDANAAMAHRKPTDAQKAAGNYAKGHVRIHGMDIAIENARGSARSGTDVNGQKWSCKLPAHYGYLKGTEGADGDHVDVYLGPHLKSPSIFVVDQKDADSGRFDEHKAFIGFANKKQVVSTYRKAFSDGRADDRMGKIHVLTVPDFKAWLKDGDTVKPLKRASGGRIPMADGGAAFDPDKYLASDVTPTFDPDSYLKTSKATPTWSDAITDIPSEIGHAASENWHAIKQGLLPSGQGERGQFENLMNTGKGLMGIPGLVLSPLTGAARSVIGHPMAQLEHKVGEVIAPEIAAKDDLNAMYQRAKGDVDLALAALPGKTKAPVSAPIAASSPANEIALAAERISQVAPNPIEVPRAFSSDSIATQRAGQLARNVPIVGDSIPRATGQMVDQLGDATKAIASSYGEGSGPNVSNRIGRALSDAAEVETGAARSIAQRSDDALLADWQRAQDVGLDAIANHEVRSLERARQAVGDMSPQDMGETLIGRLRAGEQEARAIKNRLYEIAGDSDAAINSDAVGSIRARVAQSLENDGRVVDGVLTPAASRMLDELQRFSTLNIENRAVGARPPVPGGEVPVRAAVSVRGIEQVRKRLSAIAQAATNDADRGASSRIVREFDAWESDAFDNALFSGSPDALSAYRQARDANRDWRTRFGFNERDDADRVLNRIVTGEVTPQEVSNWLVGASQVGSKGLSSRLLTRVGEATGHDIEVMQALRGGVWNRLSQSAEGATPKSPERIASGIGEFLNGSGRDLANRLYTPEQRGIMSTYADTLRRGQEARQILNDVARVTKPSKMEVGIGPMQELANAVLGKSGKTDEALFSAIDAYARSGSRGDVKTLSNILKAIPEKDRGDLAGAIIRNIGQSKATGEFSPDLFATEWNKYTPQAKSLLLGNAGPHRTALDDIAMIAQRYKEVGRRFGNPSGTGQIMTGFGALQGIISNPFVAIPSLVGGAVFARMLSSPITARKAATLGKTSLALQNGSTAARLAAFESALRAFASSARQMGANISAIDLMRAIQGPMPGRAQGEQQ